MILDTHEIAWAAGLFDGEGSTHAEARTQFNERHVTVQVAQAAHNFFVLERFRTIVRVGRVYGPYHRKGKRGLAARYKTNRFRDAQAVIAMLWKYLSPEKRDQATKALRLYHSVSVRPANTYLLGFKPGRRIRCSCGLLWNGIICNNCGNAA